MGSNGTVREGPGSLRVPLAASLLLHAVLLGLLALGLPRLLPEPAGSVEVRLVSLESEEGAGGGEGEGAAAGPPPGVGRSPPGDGGVRGQPAHPEVQQAQPGGAPHEPVAPRLVATELATREPPGGSVEASVPPLRAAVPVPAAAPPAPLPAAPPAASAPARVADAGPLGVEGPKASAPDLSLGTPSGFDVPQDSPVTGGALRGQGPAAAGSAAGGPEGGARARDSGGLVGQGGEVAGGFGGALARAQEGRLGLGDGRGHPGGGTGRDGAFAHILKRIEAAKHYPEEARRLGHRGTVAVRFRIGPDGAVAAAEVAASSGSSLLDAASLETVRRAAPLPAVPGWLRVRISYGLAEAPP